MDKLLSGELRDFLKNLGASLVSFADLTKIPDHPFSQYQTGISIAVALDKDIIKNIIDGPTPAYYEEYKRANKFLTLLAESTVQFLKRRGHESIALSPTITDQSSDLSSTLPHKTIATQAGLGWIGKSALLVTQNFGSAIRLTTVLTTGILNYGLPIRISSCGNCTRCQNICPGKAILGNNWTPGMKRDEIYQAQTCQITARSLASKVGAHSTICGRCIAVCPFTQKYLNSDICIVSNEA
ncbi:MAG: epoxyqueuosine reductase [Spirochaetes bacterium]|nr:epoxyqueuosine reductase [Spirochaetota bacterium]